MIRIQNNAKRYIGYQSEDEDIAKHLSGGDQSSTVLIEIENSGSFPIISCSLNVANSHFAPKQPTSTA